MVNSAGAVPADAALEPVPNALPFLYRILTFIITSKN